ncbi:MAG: type IV pilus assembly protein PilM [Deltaproteobacteria bacterium]|nr:type IV pilus assembly protein PilM [Deltaproteobacteria bacterium]
MTNLVGVDIGSSSIKVAQARETKVKGEKWLKLERFGFENLPPQSIVDGNVMNASAVVEALAKVFRDAKIADKNVALSVSGHSVIIKKIAVPIMTADELEEQIHWEAEQHIPFDINDVEIDHEILRRRPEQGQMDILLVAAKKDEINDYAQIAREAKLRPLVVDIDAFAIQNIFEFGYGLSPTETVVLLNVGASLTTLNIVSGGVSAFTRDIANGGNAITDEIRKQLGVSPEEAEAYKCGGGERSVVPKEVSEIIQGVAEGLAGEIQRSIDFYLATSAEGEISRIYLAGGTAKIGALGTAIERRARVPVEALDPFRKVQLETKRLDPNFMRDIAPQATVTLGLSLRRDRDKN